MVSLSLPRKVSSLHLTIKCNLQKDSIGGNGGRPLFRNSLSVVTN